MHASIELIAMICLTENTTITTSEAIREEDKAHVKRPVSRCHVQSARSYKEKQYDG